MKIKDYTNKEKLQQLFELYEEEMYANTETNTKLLKQIIEAEEKFGEKLTEKQQEEFEKINEIKNEYVGETDKNIFIYAFTLAVRLIIESIT